MQWAMRQRCGKGTLARPDGIPTQARGNEKFPHHTRFDNFLKVVKSKFFLVPTRQRGNAVGNAPALRERDAGASRRHSHAGAWEREKKELGVV